MSRLSLVLLLLPLSCADTHEGPIRCPDGTCPDAMYCLLDEGQLCVPTCEELVDGRCENGAACLMYRAARVCWPGETTGEGEVALTSYECAFGLRVRTDYEAEPIRRICERVCATDVDCTPEERCTSSTCGVPCTNPDGGPCARDSHCYADLLCVNPRRYDRLDCNGDDVLDCSLGLMCDPTDPSMCIHVPRDEE